MDHSDKPEFATEWAKVASTVVRFCYYRLGNYNDAEDVASIVARCAWRGYSSFRGDSKFATWILVIAAKQCNTFLSKALRRPPTASIETQELENLAGEPSITGFSTTRIDQLREAVDAAAVNGELSNDERVVLNVRLEQPNANMEQLGEILGQSAGQVSVLTSRAVPKLRAFLFARRPDLFGGSAMIRRAFERATAEDKLVPDEREVFTAIVLNQQLNYRRAGWRTDLRNACEKVSAFITNL